jgi:hypothetical protein
MNEVSTPEPTVRRLIDAPQWATEPSIDGLSVTFARPGAEVRRIPLSDDPEEYLSLHPQLCRTDEIRLAETIPGSFDLYVETGVTEIVIADNTSLTPGEARKFAEAVLELVDAYEKATRND